jgi:magnesium-protoporphyrin IX monomethyl ester (oxidative) cyclase
MLAGLERLRRIAAKVDEAKARGGVVGGIRRAGYTLAAVATFARLYLLPVHRNELPEQIRMAPAW